MSIATSLLKDVLHPAQRKLVSSWRTNPTSNSVRARISLIYPGQTEPYLCIKALAKVEMSKTTTVKPPRKIHNPRRA